MARRRNERDASGDEQPKVAMTGGYRSRRKRLVQQPGKQQPSSKLVPRESEAGNHLATTPSSRTDVVAHRATHGGFASNPASQDQETSPISPHPTADRKSERRSNFPTDSHRPEPSPPWWCRPFSLTLMGGFLLFLSMPPVGFWPLAFLAPIPWIAVALQPELPGKRPWLKIWLAAWVTWLALLYYIRVPHWLLNIGWVVMAAYLCCYVPLFMVVTRRAVLRWGLSPYVAAPLAWVGTEYLRSFLFGGFAMSLLGHSLVRIPIAIQFADIAGGYWVSGLVVLIGTSLFQVGRASWTLRSTGQSRVGKHDRQVAVGNQKPWVELGIPVIVAIGAIVAALSYGGLRLTEPVVDRDAKPARIALIQGTIDTTFPDTEQEANAVRERTFAQYESLTKKALKNDGPLDLIVWPEGKFTAGPDLIATLGWDRLPEVQLENARVHQAEVAWAAQLVLGATATVATNVPATDATEGAPGLLVGCSTWDLTRQQSFNSALRFDRRGEIRDRYFKMHRVMFGEYIPLADLFPVIYDWTPIGTGLTAGDTPVTFLVGEYRLAPSICFESTVPHLIRQQVRELTAAGERPDALINLSDDGWFYGTAALDHHLACNVFRAVEMRRPVLVAANTGLSAVIDSSGRIESEGGRRQEAILVADLHPQQRASLYEWLGDWPARGALLFCAAVLLSGLRFKRRSTE